MGSVMTRKRKVSFLFFFVLGTGCLLALLWKQNAILNRINRESIKWLVEMGADGSDTLAYLQKNDLDARESWALKAVPILSYLSGSQEELALREDKSMSEFAMIYPGNKCENGVWSGAAGHWSRGTRFLEETELTRQSQDDSVLADSGEEESEALETSLEYDADAAVLDAALQENKSYREKSTEDKSAEETKEELVMSRSGDNYKKIQYLKRTKSLNYLLRNFYIVDSSTSINKRIFDVETLLNTELAMKKSSEPQIYIFHTHGASEHFIDSKPGDRSESVVGVGTYLTEILQKKYGYQVIHDETEYDRINGKIDRNKAYNKAAKGLKNTLKKYPSIQVVIDLHRDGVGNKVHRLTKIDGKRTAQLMFFNGLSRNRKGEIKYLKNDNLQANLSFSLQMKLKCMELYPNLAKPVYLKSYRYNLHMRKRSLLIELGNENNTLQEAKNAMEPLAKVLNQVLSED